VGDYSAVHNDKAKNRRVAYILHLTKDWDSSWGGALVWCRPFLPIVPSFNSLTIFSVSSRTHHFVQPVSGPTKEATTCSALTAYPLLPRTCPAEPVSRRLGTSGFFFATDLEEFSHWNDFVSTLPPVDVGNVDEVGLFL
jgi:hypothetical protein